LEGVIDDQKDTNEELEAERDALVERNVELATAAADDEHYQKVDDLKRHNDALATEKADLAAETAKWEAKYRTLKAKHNLVTESDDEDDDGWA